MSATIRIQKWKWVGHVLRRDGNNTARTALTWAPDGKKPGRLQKARRRIEERERERDRERERVKVDSAAVMEGCNSICEKPGWMESISEWSLVFCGAR